MRSRELSTDARPPAQFAARFGHPVDEPDLLPAHAPANGQEVSNRPPVSHRDSVVALRKAVTDQIAGLGMPAHELLVCNLNSLTKGKISAILPLPRHEKNNLV